MLQPVQIQILNNDGTYEVVENGLHYYFKGKDSQDVIIIDFVSRLNITKWVDNECNYTDVSSLDGSNLAHYKECEG